MLYLSIYKVESLKYLGENNFQEVWKKKWGNMREREREGFANCQHIIEP